MLFVNGSIVIGWNEGDQGISHVPKQARGEESNKQNMFSPVKHETYLL